jgi:hypothetical protein
VNTRFRLATTSQIASLTAAWLAVLVLIDYRWNPHLWDGGPPPRPVSAPLGLRINHLCCSGCLSAVRSALEKLPWIEPGAVRAREERKLLTPGQVESLGPSGEYGGWVDVQVRDPGLIDFVAVDRALRENGLVASRMELGGVEHFRLEAHVPHLCCGACADAAERTVELSRALAAGRLRWVDSVTANQGSHRLVVHARFLEPGKTIDVVEFLGALDSVGIAPSSLRVSTGREQPLTGGPAALR